MRSTWHRCSSEPGADHRRGHEGGGGRRAYDRLGRFVVGPVLNVVAVAASGGFFAGVSGTLGLVSAGVALVLGVVLTVTAALQRCSIDALGIDTYRGSSAPRASSDDAPPGAKLN